MAKQTVNVGTSANDRTGDNLRSAFAKINANFDELYTELGLNLDTDLNLGAFEFTGSVLTTTDSSAVVIDQATTITSNLTVGGDVVPSVANGGDLGTADKPWNSLYVSGNTVFIGGTPVRINENGDLTVDGSVVTSGAVSYNDLTDKPTIPTVGDITFAGSTISAADDTSITIQALDEDSTLRSRISLSPDVGAVSMRGYSSESSDTFNTSDWDTATWIAGGGGGQVVIVNAAAINDFINDDLGGATGVTFSINGGTAESLGSRSYSGLSQTLTLNTVNAPDPDPTTVTEIEFFYSFSSRIGIDYDDGSVSMSARGSMNVSINSERDINLSADDDIRIEGADSFRLINTSTTAPIQIITDDTNNSYTWEFEANGGLTFPDDTIQITAWAGIPGPYADDAAAALAGVAVGYPYHKTGTSGQVFVRLS